MDDDTFNLHIQGSIKVFQIVEPKNLSYSWSSHLATNQTFMKEATDGKDGDTQKTKNQKTFHRLTFVTRTDQTNSF